MLTSEGCAAPTRRALGSLPEPATPWSSRRRRAWSTSRTTSRPRSSSTRSSRRGPGDAPDRSILVGDNLLRPFLDRSCVDEVICLEWYTGKSSAPPRRGLCRGLPRTSLVRPFVSVSSRWAWLARCRAARRSRSADPIAPEIKDPDELALIRRSVRAGEAAHAAALAEVEPGMTELDVFLLVQAAADAGLGEQVPIYGDFVSGPRCATERGGPPGHRVIERGDLFLLDFSVIVHGYRADFTNTFVVGDEPTPRQNELLRDLHGGPARPASRCFARECRQRRSTPRSAAISPRTGSTAYFPSHSGHGLGLGHPEPPYLVPESTDTLQAHDVVALEPGLYVPGRRRDAVRAQLPDHRGGPRDAHAAPAGVDAAMNASRSSSRPSITPRRPTSVPRGPARSRAPGRSRGRSRRR